MTDAWCLLKHRFSGAAVLRVPKYPSPNIGHAFTVTVTPFYLHLSLNTICINEKCQLPFMRPRFILSRSYAALDGSSTIQLPWYPRAYPVARGPIRRLGR